MPIPVTILGATGLVGQVFCERLSGHPLFKIAALVAGPESAGIPYGEAVQWRRPGPVPAEVAALSIAAAPERLSTPIAFSALSPEASARLEAPYADAGAWIFTNASAHRMDPDVPLVVPEINGDHLPRALNQGRTGAIVANPNCTTVGLALALAPLQRRFGLQGTRVVSLQARSGAGLQAGQLMELTDDLIPHITGEAHKIALELPKILGQWEPNAPPTPAAVEVTATCMRVPVPHGHTLCVDITLENAATERELHEAWTSFEGLSGAATLHSAPRPLIHVDSDPDAPRPAAHRDRGEGLAVSVGGLTRLDASRRRWSFVTLSHNLIRGAAGGAILTAEDAHRRGLLDD